MEVKEREKPSAAQTPIEGEHREVEFKRTVSINLNSEKEKAAPVSSPIIGARKVSLVPMVSIFFASISL